MIVIGLAPWMFDGAFWIFPLNRLWSLPLPGAVDTNFQSSEHCAVSLRTPASPRLDGLVPCPRVTQLQVADLAFILRPVPLQSDRFLTVWEKVRPLRHSVLMGWGNVICSGFFLV